MVSRRNYITIAIMMAILLFMFQFIGVMKNALNEFGVNEYDEATDAGVDKSDMYVAGQGHSMDVVRALKEYMIYIGDVDLDNVGKVLSWWCTYSKRELVCYKSLKECMISANHPPLAVVIDGAAIRQRDVVYLDRLIDKGANLIFARLPDKEIITRNRQLQRILGIYSVYSQDVELKGVHLFGGFLLGGEAIYEPADKEEEEKRQDFDLEIPWYVTGSGTKTYMMGMLKDGAKFTMGKIKNEALPAIIWRNGIENRYVFCVNAEYLTEMSGMGIYSAIIAEMLDYDVYPIVNARNLVMANYPGFASENSSNINRIYSRSLDALLGEIVWPTIVSTSEVADDKPSLMMTPEYDYDDDNEPEGRKAIYYLKLLKETYGEAGVSLDAHSNTSVLQKMSKDEDFWDVNVPDYKFRAYYTESEKRASDFLESKYSLNAKTVILGSTGKLIPIISYVQNADGEESIVMQKATSNGISHTYTDDIMLKSLQTALGYSNIVVNLDQVAYPTASVDAWEKYSKEMTATVDTYWKPFEAFDGTVASESDMRIRRFLALDYSKSLVRGGVDVDISNFDEQAWFIFKTKNKRIVSVGGGSFDEIEDDVYLIQADSAHIKVRWENKSDDDVYFYEDEQ